MSNPNHFTIFEHQSLVQNHNYNNNTFTQKHLQILENFYKEKDFPYYKLIRKGVRFCEYVGVLQTADLMIEILPKADKNLQNKDEDAKNWRKTLIDMLQAVGIFKIHAPSSAQLTLKSNSILDLYFELFLLEVETLLHKGLIKSYRKVEGNTTALKGNLVFAKHIQHNLIHQERFYVRHSTYDCEDILNSVLYKALQLLKNINTNLHLTSRIGALLLHFPPLPHVHVNEAWFNKIQFNRKTDAYQSAIQIAKLLILNYHPDIFTGKNDVLALMFNMNFLWEQFVFQSLRKHKPDNCYIKQQAIKPFWKGEIATKNMKPDIVIEKDGQFVVLDTKWKIIGNENPSDNDLRQMYAYSRFHNDAKTALIYPSAKAGTITGHFMNEALICDVVTLEVTQNIHLWQKNIAEHIFESNLFKLDNDIKKE